MTSGHARHMNLDGKNQTKQNTDLKYPETWSNTPHYSGSAVLGSSCENKLNFYGVGVREDTRCHMGQGH